MIVKPESETHWLELRRKYVTATEVGSILGTNKFRSANKVLQGKKEPDGFTGNAYTYIGQLLEPIVVQVTNDTLDRRFRLYEGRNFLCDDELGIGATPDAYDLTSILECKTTKPVNLVRFTGAPPDYYVLQLMTQLMLDKTKIDGYLAIMSTNLTQKSPELVMPLIIYRVTRDKRLIELIKSQVDEFWKCYNENRTMRVSSKIKQRARVLCRLCTRRIL